MLSRRKKGELLKMSFNNKKKILSQILTVCIFSSLVSATTCFATSDTEVNATVDSNANNQYINNTDNSVATKDQTYLVKKLNFEYEIQSKFDTYRNAKMTEKNQAKNEAIDTMTQLVNSDEYSIDDKRELINDAMSQALLDNTLGSLEALNLKQDFEYELNRQADVENLEATISNILSSSVTTESKKEFCLNALELSKLSGSISEDYYNSKLDDIQAELDLQQEEENIRIAKEQADKIAYEQKLQAQAEQELIEQKNISEKALAITTDTAIDINTLQTIEDTENSFPESEQAPVVETQGFEDDTIAEAEETYQESDDVAENYVFNGSINYTKQDFIALCNVVQHEVGDCSTLSKQMVASVIINRVLSDRFPSSLYDVINQDNQFTGIGSYINRTDYATEDTIYWCQYVLNNNIDYANGALFYYAPQWCGYMSYFENMTLVAEHDGQRYFS